MTRAVKVAVHVHSAWSFDGHWSLDKIAKTFARRGYRAVLLCDHDRGFIPEAWSQYREACSRASTDRIRLVPGTEYADPQNLVHVPVWGVPFLGESLPTQKVLEAVRQHQGVALLAHPGRREAWRQVDPAWLPTFSGIEVWNRKYDGVLPSREATRLLEQAPHCLAVASLDFHRRRQFFPLSLSLQIDGDIDEESVLAAIRAGKATAQAFRLPLHVFAAPALRRLLTVAEQVRKPVAGIVRRLLDR